MFFHIISGELMPYDAACKKVWKKIAIIGWFGWLAQGTYYRWFMGEFKYSFGDFWVRKSDVPQTDWLAYAASTDSKFLFDTGREMSFVLWLLVASLVFNHAKKTIWHEKTMPNHRTIRQ